MGQLIKNRYEKDMMIFLLDENQKIIFVNEYAVSVFGFVLEELYELSSIADLNPPELRETMRSILNRADSSEYFAQELTFRFKNGKIFPIEAEKMSITVDGKKFDQIIIKDISAYKKTEEALQEQLHFQQRLINTIPNPIFYKDIHGLYQGCNTAFEEYVGLKKEDLIGKSVYDISPNDLADKYFEMDSALFNKPGVQIYESSVVYADGTRHDVIFNKASYLNSDGVLAGLVGVIIDITDRKQMEERLHHLATHDSLTNIPNRYYLEENLKRVLAQTKQDNNNFLLFIDLDNFKLVNDSLGHNAGDKVLITLVNILKSHLREEDLLARLGGDEFAILLEGTTGDAGKIVAEKLRRAVDESNLCLVSYSTSINLTISIGVVKVDGSLDYQKTLSLADNALYSAKEKGRNKVIILDSNLDINIKLTHTNQMVNIIKESLVKDKFILHYQPIYEISGEITHYEALIRINHNGQLITPNNFIPIAERFGLMPQIDRWVIKAALAALQRYPQTKIFINLSGMSIEDSELLEFIQTSISESGVNANRIGFEITETTAVKDFLRARRWIELLKGLGCKFALDDFGLGFSSFTYLRMLPVDYLKIDGSFVRNMDKDPTQQALIQAINTVAHTLGKKTVAEFVENKDILDALRVLDVNMVQGYYLGKPALFP